MATRGCSESQDCGVKEKSADVSFSSSSSSPSSSSISSTISSSSSVSSSLSSSTPWDDLENQNELPYSVPRPRQICDSRQVNFCGSVPQSLPSPSPPASPRDDVGVRRGVGTATLTPTSRISLPTPSIPPQPAICQPQLTVRITQSGYVDSGVCGGGGGMCGGDGGMCGGDGGMCGGGRGGGACGGGTGGGRGKKIHPPNTTTSTIKPSSSPPPPVTPNNSPTLSRTPSHDPSMCLPHPHAHPSTPSCRCSVICTNNFVQLSKDLHEAKDQIFALSVQVRCLLAPPCCCCCLVCFSHRRYF